MQNWKEHLSNPFGNNIINNVLNIQNVLPDPGFAKPAAVEAVAQAAADVAEAAADVADAASAAM